MKYINKESVEFIKNYGDVLACKYYHGFAYPEGRNAIGDCGAESVEGKEWDVFHIHYETKDAYYGIPMLGMGLMDCMILKTDTRAFSNEDNFNYKLAVTGSHTGKISNSFNIQIEPIVGKL